LESKDAPVAGRVSFIFGGALFVVVALFCTSLEVERLGQAFEGNRN
jgi:hypothetical protein